MKFDIKYRKETITIEQSLEESKRVIKQLEELEEKK